MKYFALTAFFAVPIVAASSPGTSSPKPIPESRVDRATRLFAEGPSKATEIISLLKAELREHPDSLDAHKLLGTAYFISSRFPEAVSEFDWVVDTQLAAHREHLSVSPKLLLYRVEAIARAGKTRLALEEFSRLGAFTAGHPDHAKTGDLLRGLHRLKLVDDARRLAILAGVNPEASDLFIPFTDRGGATAIHDADLKGALALFASADAQDAVLLLDAKGDQRRWLFLFKDNLPAGITHAQTAAKSDAFTPISKIESLPADAIGYDEWNQGQLTTDDGKPLAAFTHR